MDTEPLKVGSASKYSRHVRSSPILVDIHISVNGNQREVCKDFPFDRLLKYSDRAKAELENVAVTAAPSAKLQWTVAFSAFHGGIEIGGLSQVLDWFKSLPSTGEVRGRPQIAFRIPDNSTIIDVARIWEACLEIKLAAPLTEQFKLRSGIMKFVWVVPLTTVEIDTMYNIFESSDPAMSRHVIRATNKFTSQGQAPVGLNQLRAENPELGRKLAVTAAIAAVNQQQTNQSAQAGTGQSN